MNPELLKLITRAKETMDGDSNDDEHDALVELVDYLEAAEQPIVGGLDQDSREAEAYRAAAKREYVREGSVEVDSNAVVSKGGDSGAYVAAWVWVDDSAPECQHEHFESIAYYIREHFDIAAYLEQTGGGIECIVLPTADFLYYFGTANDTWGADIWTPGPEGTFQDGESLNTTCSSTSTDVAEVALALYKAVTGEGR